MRRNRGLVGIKSDVSVSDATGIFDTFDAYNAKSNNNWPSGGIVTDNLVMHLDAGNSSSYGGSGTTWTDLSGQGNNGTISGATYTSGSPSYFDFDGSNDRINLPSIDLSGNVASAGFWMYGSASFSSSSSIIYLQATYRTFNVHLTWSDNYIYFDKGTGAGYSTNYDRINKASSSADHGWHYWVFTANASTGNMKIYVDNSLWHSGSSKTRTIGNATGSNYLGYGGIGYWRGYMSQVQLYKKELSAAEIEQNWVFDKANFGL